MRTLSARNNPSPGDEKVIGTYLYVPTGDDDGKLISLGLEGRVAYLEARVAALEDAARAMTKHACTRSAAAAPDVPSHAKGRGRSRQE